MTSRGIGISCVVSKASGHPLGRATAAGRWPLAAGRWPLAAGDAVFTRFATHTGRWRPDRRPMLNRPGDQ